MDLRLYFRVIWRFRYVVLAGLFLAVFLTAFSTFRFSLQGGTPKVSYRQAVIWRSTETLLVTQQGCLWCSTATASYAPARYATLASFLAQLAEGGNVRAFVLKGGPLGGSYAAYPVVDALRAPLPFIGIDGIATSPAGAVSVANRVSSAFRAYMRQNQERENVGPSQRVLLQVTTKATKATVDKGRRLTLPIVIFLTVLIATIGLAFILENLKPRVRAVSDLQQPPAPGEMERLADASFAEHESSRR